jgi:hypothetical protein
MSCERLNKQSLRCSQKSYTWGRANSAAFVNRTFPYDFLGPTIRIRSFHNGENCSDFMSEKLNELYK